MGFSYRNKNPGMCLIIRRSLHRPLYLFPVEQKLDLQESKKAYPSKMRVLDLVLTDLKTELHVRFSQSELHHFLKSVDFLLFTLQTFNVYTV